MPKMASSVMLTDPSIIPATTSFGGLKKKIITSAGIRNVTILHHKIISARWLTRRAKTADPRSSSNRTRTFRPDTSLGFPVESTCLNLVSESMFRKKNKGLAYA